MAGRIKDEDIALVREKSQIADVVGAVVGLRNAGGGSLKGLCPFHDEKTPSFNVNPTRGFFHCFGCGEGGDVIDFVMKTDHLSFSDAIERLAGKAGIVLRYEEGGSAPRQSQGTRTRMVEAHHAAAEFYADLLANSPDAAPGRAFLSERGFDAEAAAHFQVGFAPRDWDSLVKHLRGRRFTDEELTNAGLARQGQRGLLDRFMGRLLWPIHDVTGDIVGFGARRLFDDDRIEAEVRQHPRDRHLQEEPPALRPGAGQEGDQTSRAGRHRRGLHRRDGLPPCRGADRRGHLRHRVRRRPREAAAPPAHGRQ